MVALLAPQTLHHDQCGILTSLKVGQRYIICPCWVPLNDPGPTFIPRSAFQNGSWRQGLHAHATNRWTHADRDHLRKGWGGYIVTAQSISHSGQSIWVEGCNGWRGMTVHRRFLQRTNLMDLNYLIESPGHPATIDDRGNETCPADCRTVTVRAASIEEAEIRLNTVFAADVNEWGNRESIMMLLSGS